MYIWEGQVYVAGNMSAQSITDRTPYPASKQEAIDAIKSVEGKDGKLEHTKMHPSLIGYSHKPWDPHAQDPGRNLSATVSALTEVVKDLLERIEKLEKP